MFCISLLGLQLKIMRFGYETAALSLPVTFGVSHKKAYPLQKENIFLKIKFNLDCPVAAVK